MAELQLSSGGLSLLATIPSATRVKLSSNGHPSLTTVPPVTTDVAALVQGGEAIYHAIGAYYELQLDSVGKGLVVGLAPSVQDRLPWAFVTYLRNPAPCHVP